MSVLVIFYWIVSGIATFAITSTRPTHSLGSLGEAFLSMVFGGFIIPVLLICRLVLR